MGEYTTTIAILPHNNNNNKLNLHH